MTDASHLTKKDFALLEKVFAREIDGLILQSKSKEYDRLETKGYVEHVTEFLGGRFPMEIKGWCLTHLGRWAYCAACLEIDEEDL